MRLFTIADPANCFGSFMSIFKRLYLDLNLVFFMSLSKRLFLDLQLIVHLGIKHVLIFFETVITGQVRLEVLK